MNNAGHIDLAVVMPTYNEEDSIKPVVVEWLQALQTSIPSFILIVLDDGSTDGTANTLATLESLDARIKIIGKKNTGHGQTCVQGYREAIAAGAGWILQVDSDGQCDPRFLAEFWQKRTEGCAVMGFRKTRGDGLIRALISQALSFVVFALTGKFLKDANVPYRLMDSDSLSTVVSYVPGSFYLANVLVSYLYARLFQIEWCQIEFRVRAGGETKAKGGRIVRLAAQLIGQMIDFNAHFYQLPSTNVRKAD